MEKLGISRFYRWCAERWPCINETVREGCLPPTDNLYLDITPIAAYAASQSGANGDTSAVFQTIYNGIDRIVQLVKPNTFIFLAIDGKV